MLVWINGAFGAGKTQTAHELHRRLATSHVADPEVVETLADDLGLELVRPRFSPARYRLRRLAVTARHIRF